MDAFDTRPQAGSIKSIQRGVISGSLGASATISPVNTSKSVLSILGTNTTNPSIAGLGYLVLTSPTVITQVGGSANGTTTTSWQLVEYN